MSDPVVDYRPRAVLGIALYLLLAFAPLWFMLSGPTGISREPLREFAVALGFSALGLLSMQVALSARLRRLTAAYGIDAVYHFHRRMGPIALGLVLAHPVLLITVTPQRVELLNVFAAPWPARFAVAAAASVVVTAIMSIGRRRLRLAYERWKGWHDVLALLILGLASLHIAGVGIYVREGTRLAAFAVYPMLWLALLGYVRLGKPLTQRRRQYRVTAVEPLTSDVWSIRVEPHGHGGLSFLPGQFGWFKIGGTPFSIEEHPFSFSSAPRSDGAFEIAAKELGDFTRTIGQTALGTVVFLDGPHGAFVVDRYSPDSVVYIAGGIGITPIMSHLRTAAAAPDQAVPMTLVYGAVSESDLAYREEIDRIAEKLPLHVVYVVEQPSEGWAHETGMITREVLERAVSDPTEHHYFVCGPPAMTDAIERSLKAMGVDAALLHYERFALA